MIDLYATIELSKCVERLNKEHLLVVPMHYPTLIGIDPAYQMIRDYINSDLVKELSRTNSMRFEVYGSRKEYTAAKEQWNITRWQTIAMSSNMIRCNIEVVVKDGKNLYLAVRDPKTSSGEGWTQAGYFVPRMLIPSGCIVTQEISPSNPGLKITAVDFILEEREGITDVIRNQWVRI